MSCNSRHSQAYRRGSESIAMEIIKVPTKLHKRGDFPNMKEIIIRPGKVNLIVSGHRHTVLWHTLGKIPKTRLYNLYVAKNEERIGAICDFYDKEKNEYYFSRHPQIFMSVLNFYRTGKLHHMVCVFFENFVTFFVTGKILNCRCKAILGY